MRAFRFQVASPLIGLSTHRAVVIAFALVIGAAPLASAQTPAQAPSANRTSIAVETDILAFFIGGYSAMVNVSFPNKFQMRSGPALGGVILNQNWRLQSAPLNGETTFREVSAGVTGGYYIHVEALLHISDRCIHRQQRVLRRNVSQRHNLQHRQVFAQRILARGLGMVASPNSVQ
jgi:hypothetical protein